MFTKNNNSKGFARWFIIILASSAIIFTGFLLLNRPPQTPTSFKQEVPANLPRNNNLRSWKTYRNEEYGFEFRYPIDWKVKEDARYPHVQLQVVKDGKVNAIAGSITRIDKETSPDYSTLAKMFASDTQR